MQMIVILRKTAKIFEMPHIATFAERKIFRHRWENS